jgi:hypothetical protein
LFYKGHISFGGNFGPRNILFPPLLNATKGISKGSKGSKGSTDDVQLIYQNDESATSGQKVHEVSALFTVSPKEH